LTAPIPAVSAAQPGSAWATAAWNTAKLSRAPSWKSATYSASLEGKYLDSEVGLIGAGSRGSPSIRRRFHHEVRQAGRCVHLVQGGLDPATEHLPHQQDQPHRHSASRGLTSATGMETRNRVAEEDDALEPELAGLGDHVPVPGGSACR